MNFINFTHEFQHETGCLFTPDFLRGADLFDITLAHDHHAVSDFHRFFLIVSHEHAGEFQFFMQLTQPAAQLFTHLCVQRAKRFIQQQNLRFNRQRTGQRHTLFLTAGKLCRITVCQMAKLHHLQQFSDFLFDGFSIRTLTARQHRQAKRDVVEHRHMAEQRIMLENETDLTITGMQARHVFTVKTQVSGALIFQVGDNTQQRGFT
ncbi:hypothetical protein SRABI106_01646 [Rahnella aquatilis]|nr:hypothetical protein SRABI106_01646 [Rahnella aquatilis]